MYVMYECVVCCSPVHSCYRSVMQLGKKKHNNCGQFIFIIAYLMYYVNMMYKFKAQRVHTNDTCTQVYMSHVTLLQSTVNSELHAF